MFQFIFCLLVLFPAAVLTSFEVNASEMQISEGPVPSWIKECNFSLEPVPLKPSQVNLQFLLTDIQRNAFDQKVYFHFALKPVSQSGVSAVANVDIDFSPTYQNVVVHFIRVFRNGVWQDRLQTARHSVLQRESQLEMALYHGVHTHVYFLEDICEGDIVEYAYSIEGEIPYFSSHLTNVFHLQGGVIFEKLYRRILVNRDCPFDYKLFDCSIEPRVSNLSDKVCEWSWELEETPLFPYDDDMPLWYFPLARVEFSQYRSWNEVIQKLLPIYELPDDFEVNLPHEMVRMVEGWMKAAADPEERAFLALRFVQEKLRYLGFEEGLDGYKPHDPRTVFTSRFGDCKDKTFLLHALLKLMGIASTPVLVHSSDGQNVPDSLPSPFAFDHIVLRIEIEGSEFWVDPTLCQQGGAALWDNFFPIYGWGLPLSANETGLIELPANYNDRPTEIDTTFTVVSFDSAQMKIVRKFCGYKADYMRRYLDWRGIQNFSDDFLEFLQKTYGSAQVVASPVLLDDREGNVLILTQTYQVPIHKRRGNTRLKIFSITVSHYVDGGVNPERNSPYALIYPTWVKEHIHVEDPFIDWEYESLNHQFEHESLYYSYSQSIGGHCFDLDYELKHLKDHVSTDALYEYWEIVNSIEEEGLLNLTVSDFKKSAA